MSRKRIKKSVYKKKLHRVPAHKNPSPEQLELLRNWRSNMSAGSLYTAGRLQQMDEREFVRVANKILEDAQKKA